MLKSGIANYFKVVLRQPLIFLKEIVKLAEEKGWKIKTQKGSHMH